jgi:hypothetical protein
MLTISTPLNTNNEKPENNRANRPKKHCQKTDKFGQKQTKLSKKHTQNRAKKDNKSPYSGATLSNANKYIRAVLLFHAAES